MAPVQVLDIAVLARFTQCFVNPTDVTESRLSTMDGGTVDGRNPAPVDRWFIPLFIEFQPSKVVEDFFHPLYDHV